jgi:hypothetical protein
VVRKNRRSEPPVEDGGRKSPARGDRIVCNERISFAPSGF